jgi:hypothetical protein
VLLLPVVLGVVPSAELKVRLAIGRNAIDSSRDSALNPPRTLSFISRRFPPQLAPTLVLACARAREGMPKLPTLSRSKPTCLLFLNAGTQAQVRRRRYASAGTQTQVRKRAQVRMRRRICANCHICAFLTDRRPRSYAFSSPLHQCSHLYSNSSKHLAITTHTHTHTLPHTPHLLSPHTQSSLPLPTNVHTSQHRSTHHS